MEFLGHATVEVACTLGSSPGWKIVEDTPDAAWSRKDVGMIASFWKMIKTDDQSQRNDCKVIHTGKV